MSMSLEQLIIDMKDSLEREMHAIGSEMHGMEARLSSRLDKIDLRFEAQAARLDRLDATIRAGGRWTSAMIDWAGKVDTSLDEYGKQILAIDTEIAEAGKRLAKLERKSNGSN
ncbi:MAG: hypothetical protein ACKV2U_25070 [Bryobacteraceae bacterium]